MDILCSLSAAAAVARIEVAAVLCRPDNHAFRADSPKQGSDRG